VSVHPVSHSLTGSDGTTGQDGASLSQLAAISSPWWRDGWTTDDGTAIIVN